MWLLVVVVFVFCFVGFEDFVGYGRYSVVHVFIVVFCFLWVLRVFLVVYLVDERGI